MMEKEKIEATEKWISDKFSWADDLVTIRSRLYWAGHGVELSEEKKKELQFQFCFLQLEGRDYGFF